MAKRSNGLALHRREPRRDERRFSEDSKAAVHVRCKRELGVGLLSGESLAGEAISLHPEWTHGANLAVGVIDTLFMWATDDSVR